MNYSEVIAELVAANIMSAEEVFNYANSKYGRLYDDYFNFCQSNLVNNENGIDIQPARIFFRDVYSVNAHAGKGKGYFVIKIHRGTIEILYDFFDDRAGVFDMEQFSRINELAPYVDVPISLILFQTATLFTFHHERAHLIQKAGICEFSFQESYLDGNNADYSLPHHIYEMDADMLATHFCVMHLLGYWDSIKEADRTVDKLERILVLGLASLLVYFIYLMGNDYQIYYRDKHHPHLIVRTAYIADLMLRTVNANIDTQSNISDRQILRQAIVLADHLFKYQNENRMENFAEIFLYESDNITDYINFLITESKEYSNLAFVNP